MMTELTDENENIRPLSNGPMKCLEIHRTIWRHSQWKSRRIIWLGICFHFWIYAPIWFHNFKKSKQNKCRVKLFSVKTRSRELHRSPPYRKSFKNWFLVIFSNYFREWDNVFHGGSYTTTEWNRPRQFKHWSWYGSHPVFIWLQHFNRLDSKSVTITITANYSNDKYRSSSNLDGYYFKET